MPDKKTNHPKLQNESKNKMQNSPVVKKEDALFLADRALQQGLILVEFFETNCSKAEAMSWQMDAILKDLRKIKDLLNE